jgi:hypothetical protein
MPWWDKLLRDASTRGAFAVASYLWFQIGITRQTKTTEPIVKINLSGLPVDRKVAQRGLKELVKIGLVEVQESSPGQCNWVKVLSI